MHTKNGMLKLGPAPKNVGRQKGVSIKKKSQQIVKHRPFATSPKANAGNIDSLLRGGTIRACFIRQLGGLGDVIMMTPIARGAKKKYANIHITYAVDTESYNGDLANILLYHPYIDEIVDYRTIRNDDYHISKDLTRSGLQYEKPYTVFPNRIDLFARAAGIPLFGQPAPILVLTEAEEEFGKSFINNALSRIKPRAKVAVHIRSNDPKRTWPKENLKAFLSLLKREGYHSFLFGWGDNPNEWNLAGVTQVFDHPARHSAAILKQCDVLICPDSSMLHIGGCFNMKTVSLFGSMPPACRINHYKNAIAVINQKIPCIGCVYAPCENRYYCMRSIAPETVFRAMTKKLNDKYIELNSEEVNSPIVPEEASLEINEVKTVEL